MSILVDASTRILVQGITGGQAQVDTGRAIRYGARVVAGVAPGRGGSVVYGVPGFDTVSEATELHPCDATVIYAPPLAAKSAVLEALDAGLRLILVTAEGVPLHDVSVLVAAARNAGATLIGCNTNGVISPGKSRLGGIGGVDPNEIYTPGTIGICSRSGGMSAEVALTLKADGFGVSTCVSMGGDQVTGTKMAEIVRMFADDPETQGIVIFGEPGTTNEQEVAELAASGRIGKPVAALIAGTFQERHPAGQSFGHAAAMVLSSADTASAKKAALREAGVFVAETLGEIPAFLKGALRAP
ncbi:MAG: succinate--CoA ligase subunit alpha [Hyphomicrobiaceae bacterium]